MKKILLNVLALIFILSVAGFAEGSAEPTPSEPTPTQQPIVLRLAENQPADYPTTIGDYKFAELVKQRTNGRITIEVYHSKQLGEEKAVIEQVQFGAIDFARVSLSPMATFYKPLDALQMPYLYRDADHMWKVLNGAIGDELLNGVKSANFVGLCFYDSGSRSFYTKTPVNKPADLKGLKIRVQESALMVGLVESFGAVANPMPFGEVYSALQTGVIDGAENNWPSYDSTGHYEVAKYYILDAHTRVPEIVVASKITFDKLSPEDQKIILQAAKDSVATQRKAWEDKEKASEEKVRAAGNFITEVPDNSAFQAAVQPMYDKLSAELKAIVEKIRAVK
jgi:tripartite ATP-independent transporter DctP family solute receptor